MWSLGCILVELVTRKPLFPAHDEEELLDLIHFRIGTFPEHLIMKCKKRKNFFDQDFNLIGSKWIDKKEKPGVHMHKKSRTECDCRHFKPNLLSYEPASGSVR